MMSVYDFAMKWLVKIQDPDVSFIDLVESAMADDCSNLGFEMDCGHAFSERYGDASYSDKALSAIIKDVTDIDLLGSAIYSRWRYFNHWAYSAAEILEPDNRAWFVLALSRLAQLSYERQASFKGELKKIRIVSDNVCFGPRPEPDEEVEQRITINSAGRVWYSSYQFGDGSGQSRKGERRSFSIAKDTARQIMDAFTTCFSGDVLEAFATDIGTWVMDLTNTDGKTYRYRESLCAKYDYNGTDLSDFVRSKLEMPGLFLLDGNCD